MPDTSQENTFQYISKCLLPEKKRCKCPFFKMHALVYFCATQDQVQHFCGRPKITKIKSLRECILII